MGDDLILVSIERPDDVFVLRQRARDAAAAAGFDEADQVRVATALSEIGREIVSGRATGTAAFSLTGGGRTLSARVVGCGTDGTAGGPSPAALSAAGKLMDDVVSHVGTDGTPVVTVHKHLPLGRTSDLEFVRAALASAPTSPLEELRKQNQELIATLGELTTRQEDLLRLNAELEETNRGVLAMYGQLADELEETNRGVVALYAELDDKTVQLAEASEAKSRFLASVSHELRSPVNSVLGLARLLASPATGELTGDQRHQVDLIERSARELLTLVNNLLDLAKAESGRLEPEVGEVDLDHIFTDVRGALGPLIGDHVELQVDAPAGLPPVETDPDLLVHVVRNLLTNGLKFTEQGTVQLRARALSPLEVAIEVSDTGVGIAPEDLERIFEEFYQVKGPLQVRGRGTGLGLPYARRVARALGGDLTVESRLGAGSTFTVTLPVRWSPTLTGSRSPGLDSAEPTEIGAALVVDDDEGFRRILRGMLQGLAGQVVEAGSGTEALDLMARAIPDVVFLDLRMPDMDGAEVLAHMAQVPRLRQVPVIVVTSVDLETSAARAAGRATISLAKSSIDRAVVAAALVRALADRDAGP